MRPLLATAAAVALLVPWLWPFALGPSTAVMPWLVGAACACVASLITGGAVSRTFAVAAAFAVPIATFKAVSPLEPAALGGALAVIALAAGVGAWLLRNDRVEAIARVWWLAAALSTLMALIQYFGVSHFLSPWVSPTEAGAAYANLRQRNQFATLTAIGTAALLWEARRGRPILLLAAAAAWMAIGNAASVSRTGLVELLVLAGLATLWPTRTRGQSIVAGISLAAYAVSALALPKLLALTGAKVEDLWQRVAAPGACGARPVLWSNVSHLIAQHPFTGWGWGELDYAHFETLYSGARFCDILDNAHDLPLHLAVELGLPIAAAVCIATLVVAVRAKPWKESNTHRQLAWCVAALIAIHSLLEYPLWYAPFQLAFGLAVGMLWPGDVRTFSRSPRLLPAACALLVAYASWDYARVSQIYLPPEDRMAGWRDDPLARIRDSWLFSEYVEFAELTITPLTRGNARVQYESALKMLHYSPEPRIAEKVIESATMLGHTEVAQSQLARFRAAFPKEHAEWLRAQASGRTERQDDVKD